MIYEVFAAHVNYQENQIKQGVPRTTSSIRAVLFEVSCKSISRKSKIVFCYFCLIPDVAIEGLLCKTGVLTVLAKSLKKPVKEFVF